MRLAGLMAAVLIGGSLLAGCSKPAPPTPVEDRIIDTRADDAALNAAMAQAVGTLDVFWAKFDAKAPGTSEYVVKLGIVGQDGHKEFIWAEPLRRTDKEVVARLANDPEHLRGLSYGSEVRVSKDLIYDWSYQKGGKAYGHYSTRILLQKMAPGERAQVEAMLAPTPLEPNPS